MSDVKKPISKYAQFTSQGQIRCIVCNDYVKSEILWATHAAGKKHKDNVAAASTVNASNKLGKSSCNSDSMGNSLLEKSVGASSSSSVVKRRAEDDDTNIESDVKKIKQDLPDGFFDKDSNIMNIQETPKVSSEETSLPSDFFDGASKNQVLTLTPKTTTDFDDDWDKFQQEVAETVNEEPSVEEEDPIDSLVYGVMERGAEQEQLLSRVDELRKKGQEIKTRMITDSHPESAKSTLHDHENGLAHTGADDVAEDSEDDEEYDDFMNWRARRA